MVVMRKPSACLPEVDLFGVKFQLYDRDALLEKVQQTIATNSKILVLSGNVHAFNLVSQNEWLRHFFNQADIIRLDGEGVRLGIRILTGKKAPPRMTWADFFWDLGEFGARRGYTFFFLGARPGVADKAAARLRERFPEIRVVGTHHGYFDKTPGSQENERVVLKINAVSPNILIVGFGMPIQEQWVMENWARVNANVIFTGGAAFDYASGELKRAPRWMTEHGLEWLGRLIIEPGRLWKRYLIGNPLFFWRVFMQRVGVLRF